MTVSSKGDPEPFFRAGEWEYILYFFQLIYFLKGVGPFVLFVPDMRIAYGFIQSILVWTQSGHLYSGVESPVNRIGGGGGI